MPQLLRRQRGQETPMWVQLLRRQTPAVHLKPKYLRYGNNYVLEARGYVDRVPDVHLCITKKMWDVNGRRLCELCQPLQPKMRQTHTKVEPYDFCALICFKHCCV